jgi:hypothetical protein
MSKLSTAHLHDEDEVVRRLAGQKPQSRPSSRQSHPRKANHQSAKRQ